METLELQAKEDYGRLDHALRMLSRSMHGRYVFDKEKYPEIARNEWLMPQLENFRHHYTRYQFIKNLRRVAIFSALIPMAVRAVFPELGEHVQALVDSHGGNGALLASAATVGFSMLYVEINHYMFKVAPSKDYLEQHALAAHYMRPNIN